MATDVFPKTLRTWIDVELDRGHDGRSSVNHYLMETYAWPLKVYFLGTNSRWLGEPEDIVGGFFASRLGRDQYLVDWQRSGKRLRHWLMNGFSFYLKELARERRKEARNQAQVVDDDVVFDGSPEDAVDRAAALAFVNQAMDETRELCLAQDLEPHWQMFLRHHLDDLPFAAVAEEFGVTPARSNVMARTAGRKFRSVLREVLVRDGVSEEDVDHEIRGLLEAMRS